MNLSSVGVIMVYISFGMVLLVSRTVYAVARCSGS